MEPVFPLIFATILVGLLIYARKVSKVVVYDFQKGLLYKKGTFVKVLGAGRYSFIKGGTDIQIVDTRRMMLALAGQEILTKDNISLKMSLVGFYEVTDPVKAKHGSQNYISEIYNLAQVALRESAAAYTIDELLEKKAELDDQLLVRIKDKAAVLGVTFAQLSVRDIMLPANLKKAFSGIIEAKKEAQTQLEKARGEQAVLRNLANAAGLYDANPQLLQARIIQTLANGNNTVVFGTSDKPVVIK